jgi:hypothetical protein
VSAKLTPEICINNATSNSRLTTEGRQATAADTILRTIYRLFFSFLPTFDEKTTKQHQHAEKLTETVLNLTWDTLWGFFWFLVFGFFCCAVLFYLMHPL